MTTSATPNDVMRFVQLRTPDSGTDETINIRLLTSNLSGRLAAVPRDDRSEIAEDWFDDTGEWILDDLSDNDLYNNILELANTLLEETDSPTVEDLFLKLDESDWFEGIDAGSRDTLTRELSDVLLASFYNPENQPPNISNIERVFTVLRVLDIADREDVELADLDDSDEGPEFLNLGLEEVFERRILITESMEADYEQKFSIGIADLLVVKEHIKKYEPVEIAHIENVMASEKRERNHRRLDRSEEVFTTERETEVVKENELQTSERFEMSEETSRTVKEDQEIKFGTAVSGKYGNITFSSDFQFERSRSREETTSSSSKYAKDIMERSLERVRERVRRKRKTRILEEVEETNTHAFDNTSDDHIKGIYQFVDKVFQAQVFNYGNREMLDLTVPEPASYLWNLREENDGSGEGPERPEKPMELSKNFIPHLDKEVTEVKDEFDDISASDSEKLYEHLAAQYRADIEDPPPDENKTVSVTKKHPKADGGDGDSSVSTKEIEVNLPQDYKPESFSMSAIAVVNNHKFGFVGYTFLDKIGMRGFDDPDPDNSLRPFASEKYSMEYINPGAIGGIGTHNPEILLFGTDDVGTDNEPIKLDDETYSSPEEESLRIGIFAYETLGYVANIKINCKRTEEALQKWRLKTFNKLKSAYEDRLAEFKEALAKFEQEMEQRQDEENTEREFGTSPSRKEEIIRTELKKHCSSIIKEDFFSTDDDHDVMEDSTPPTFDFESARRRGSFAKFFEQVFEWEHMQYVFYPYYWAEDDTWEKRFDEEDPAHRYRQFLQAGWARVVIPVRPGFEDALHYYFQTGDVWLGRDSPPRVGDELHLSIADEIRNRTEDSVLDAVPQGPSWEVRVPTSLVNLREQPEPPKWERVEPDPGDEPKDHWDWRPVSPGEG